MRVPLLVFLLFVPGLVSVAEGASVYITTDKQVITVGDEVLLNFTVHSDLSTRVFFPKPHLMDLGDFRLKKAEKFVHNEVQSGNIWSQTLVVTSFELGEVKVPAQKFIIEAEGTRSELFSEPVTLTVDSVLANESDASDIRGLKGQLLLVVWWTRLKWLLALLGALAGALLIFKKWLKRAALLPIKPDRPAHELALAEIQALRLEQLVAKGRVKEFYIKLSGIVRTYLERRYGILVLDRTTEELLTEMKSKRIDQDATRMTREFLGECDLVKFAKFQPREDDTEAALKVAIQIVETTKLPLAPSPQEAAGQGRQARVRL